MKRNQGAQRLAIILVLSMGLMECRAALIPIPTKTPFREAWH